MILCKQAARCCARLRDNAVRRVCASCAAPARLTVLLSGLDWWWQASLIELREMVSRVYPA